jgi:hypothetical protein
MDLSEIKNIQWIKIRLGTAKTGAMNKISELKHRD